MKQTWIALDQRPKTLPTIAIVGSPGLRSIGKLVTDKLIHQYKGKLIGHLFSTHFPIQYQTKPAYASQPHLPGIGGVHVSDGNPELPSVKFYYVLSPPLLIIDGYHPNFNGQYEVGDKVLEVCQELAVQRIIVVAGYGLKGDSVCVAATSQTLLSELRDLYHLNIGYEGPFYGFSGMIFGLAKTRGLDAITLFGQTTPDSQAPEKPDESAAQSVLDILLPMLETTAVQ
jgi:proteasome assembly chaperone (PAC2) family protein